ncbi:MAG TPA: antibiotic biosynthesis monooxygenase [Terriglobales bacterium]|nr:antibiotic biosynthesis monooxygenase [Terriglobales bacterium]
MFVRNISMHLKPNTLSEFTRTLESEIIPLLRKQKGFRDEITAVVSGEREVVAISFWDEKENAEAYTTSTYPQVLTSLGKVLEGTPHVRTCEVISSTLHKIAARAAA